MSSVSERLSTYLQYALYLGLFVLVAGFFTSAGSSTHHTILYLGLFIPALAAVLFHAPRLLRDLRQDPVLQGFTALLIWMGISVLWTDFDRPDHLFKLLAMLWVMVLAVRIMLDNMRLFTITISLALTVAAVAVVITVIGYFQDHGDSFYLHRLGKLGEQQVPEIVVGKLAAVLVLYCLMQERLQTERWLRIGFGLLALVFLFPLVLSFSRTAILALALTGLWFTIQRRNNWAALFISTTTVLLFLVMVLDNDNQWLTNISRSVTLEIRLWGWKATWQEIVNQPWLGHGLRAPFIVDWSNTPYASSGMAFWHAHNLFLAMWYDTGLVGVLMLVTLLALMVRKLRPMVHIPEVRYWSYIFLFVVLASLVDSPSLADRPDGDWLWFWLPFAITMNADKIMARPARSYLQSTLTLPPVIHYLPVRNADTHADKTKCQEQI